MGYSTKFEGAMTLNPPLTSAQLEEFKSFCEERHGDNLKTFEGSPGFWCDWDTSGTKIFWNGMEKSYYMSEWLEVLITKFLQPWGVKVSGKMLAQGERRNDSWTMEVGDDQKVVVRNFSAADLGITY